MGIRHLNSILFDSKYKLLYKKRKCKYGVLDFDNMYKKIIYHYTDKLYKKCNLENISDMFIRILLTAYNNITDVINQYISLFEIEELYIVVDPLEPTYDYNINNIIKIDEEFIKENYTITNNILSLHPKEEISNKRSNEVDKNIFNKAIRYTEVIIRQIFLRIFNNNGMDIIHCNCYPVVTNTETDLVVVNVCKDIYITDGLCNDTIIISEDNDFKLLLCTIPNAYISSSFIYFRKNNKPIITTNHNVIMFNPYNYWRKILGDKYTKDYVYRLSVLFGNDYSVNSTMDCKYVTMLFHHKNLMKNNIDNELLQYIKDNTVNYKNDMLNPFIFDKLFKNYCYSHDKNNLYKSYVESLTLYYNINNIYYEYKNFQVIDNVVKFCYDNFLSLLVTDNDEKLFDENIIKNIPYTL